MSHRHVFHNLVINDLLIHIALFQKQKPNDDGKNDNSNKVVKRGRTCLPGRNPCTLLVVNNINQKKNASILINYALSGTEEFSVPNHPSYHAVKAKSIYKDRVLLS